MDVDEALAILGLDRSGASAEAIHDRYIIALKAHHPDTNPHPESTRRTAAITAAFRVLQEWTVPTGKSDVTTAESAAASPTTAGPMSDGTTNAGEPPSHACPASASAAATVIGVGVDGAFTIGVIADDTIELGLPTDLAAQFILGAAHHIGEVIYLDRSEGLVQLLVRFVDQPLCQIILDLQGRAAGGTTEVFCSIASMDDRPAPPIDAVTEYIADRLIKSSDSPDA